MTVASESTRIMHVSDHQVEVPGDPYDLWLNGELHDFLHLPHDGTQVEIIGGEIVVSPAPVVRHNTVVESLTTALTLKRADDPDYPWRLMQTSKVGFVGVGDGFVPDLIVMDVEVLDAADDADVPAFVPDQIEMAVEVTSPKGADDDRRPQSTRSSRRRPTKWTCYARAEVPYYLLIDRDPKVAGTTLYSIPDQASGAHLHEETWPFGETVRLPEPFSVEIDTSRWKPWTR